MSVLDTHVSPAYHCNWCTYINKRSMNVGGFDCLSSEDHTPLVSCGIEITCANIEGTLIILLAFTWQIVTISVLVSTPKSC